MMNDKWLLHFIWLVFFLTSLIGVIGDIMTLGWFNLSQETSIDASFFMFYTAWYTTLGESSK